jgi:hypothetical protein
VVADIPYLSPTPTEVGSVTFCPYVLHADRPAWEAAMARSYNTTLPALPILEFVNASAGPSSGLQTAGARPDYAPMAVFSFTHTPLFRMVDFFATPTVSEGWASCGTRCRRGERG